METHGCLPVVAVIGVTGQKLSDHCILSTFFPLFFFFYVFCFVFQLKFEVKFTNLAKGIGAAKFSLT